MDEDKTRQDKTRQDKTRQDKTRQNNTLVVFCSIVFVIIVITTQSVTAIKSIGKSNSKQLLLSLCHTGQENLNAYIERVEHSVKLISSYVESDLKDIEDLNSEKFSKHITRQKAIFAKMVNFTNGVYTYYYRIDPEISKTNKGFWFVNDKEKGFQEHEVTDITLYDTKNTAKLVWFTVPKSTKKAIWLPPYITDTLNARVISYNCPVFWKNRFIGVLGIEIDYTTMADQVDSLQLYKNGYAFITDSEGKLIYHPKIDVTTMKTAPKVPDGLISDKANFSYTYAGIEKQAIWLPLSNGMRLNLTVPISEISVIWQEWVNKIVYISILLLVLIVFLFIYIYHFQKLHKKTEDEKLILEKQHEQLDNMIAAMASDYTSLYYVNLETDEAICYRHDSNKPDQFQEGINFKYTSWIKEYCNLYVDDDYKEGFLRFIDINKIRNSLVSQDIIAYHYLVKRDNLEYYEMIRLASVNHPNEESEIKPINDISLGFSNIDKEMRETIETNRALSAALKTAEQANKAKTAFLSNMSHELRTPMNAIIGLDNIALNEPDGSIKIKEYLTKIDTSAHHLLGIINDILDMSRIESGQIVIKSEKFSFDELIEQIKDIIEVLCNDKGIKFVINTKGKIDKNYVGDAMKLKQLLINILNNAVKFTPEGGSIKFTIKEITRFDHKTTMQFVITDSGIGMSEEFLPHLFERFSQENSSVNNKLGSTGLGMAITKSIVELMNGNIEVKSKKGVGTTFTVTITLDETEQKNTEKDESDSLKISESMKKHTDLKGCHVLLAEDVIVNSEIIVMLLKPKEVEVDVASNGKIAVEMFNSHQEGYYDAILMDMHMPEMNGLEATKVIRNSDRSDAKVIPIIALTANAFEEDVQLSMQSGCNAHLLKPIEPQKLFDTLEQSIKP